MNSSGLPAAMLTWPPSSAVSASPPELKRTTLSLMPAADSKTAIAMSSAVPAEPMETDFGRLRLRILHQIGRGLVGRILADEDQVVVEHQVRDRRQVAPAARVLHRQRRDLGLRIEQHQRVRVGVLRRQHVSDADRRATAGLVDGGDVDRDQFFLGHDLDDHAREQVGAAAKAVRNHELDVARRLPVRGLRAGNRHARGERERIHFNA